MSLSGLLRVITDDPELRRTLDEADSPASPGGDLIAPPALRPFLVAALAGGGRADASSPRARPPPAPPPPRWPPPRCAPCSSPGSAVSVSSSRSGCARTTPP